MQSISSQYNRFRKFPGIDDEPGSMNLQMQAASMLQHDPKLIQIPAMINIAASFLLWWRTRPRTVWRALPATAEYVRTVNLSFIPEQAPATWRGDAVVIESTKFDAPFLHDIFSLACYRTADMEGEERYFFTYLKYPDGAFSFSISADLAKLNRQMAESGEMFKHGTMVDDDDKIRYRGDTSHAIRTECFDIIRFVFAFSYYLDAPKRIKVSRDDGPLIRGRKGKPIKNGGRVQPMWRYANVAIQQEAAPRESGEPLEKEDLSLEPVIVSPHIRRRGDRVIIVDQYDSHRWKRVEPVATKKTI